MPPSAALQARIRQFESLESDNFQKDTLAGRPRYPPIRTYAPPLTSHSSSISSLSDPMGEPVSPTAASYTVIQPSVPYVPRKPRTKSPSPSPPNLGCKTSLIDLNDWVIEEGRNTGSQLPLVTSGKAKPIAPPLPPRKSSHSSNGSGPSTRSRSPYDAGSSLKYLPSHGSSNTLTVEHTYPPSSKGSSSSNMRSELRHVHASSTSSFHSVSLSSDGGIDGPSSVSGFARDHLNNDKESIEEHDKDHDRDRDSVDDTFSFETVSSTGISSPALSSTHDWEKDFTSTTLRPKPPNFPPQRIPIVRTSHGQAVGPLFSTPSSPPSSSKISPALSRGVPPLPRSLSSKSPPFTSHRASLASNGTSASDRSSIFSTGTVTTAHTSIGSYAQLLRPAPVPASIRIRYETVFCANVKAQQRLASKRLSPFAAESSAAASTPRKGWRGLSVDFITNPEENPLPSTHDDGPGAQKGKLEGLVIKAIWSKSKIPAEKLRDIWNECALPGQKHLDMDSFVKGMWRIEEELRRLQGNQSTSTSHPYSSRRTTIELLH